MFQILAKIWQCEEKLYVRGRAWPGFDWNTEYHRVVRDEGRVVSKGQNMFPQVLLSKGITGAYSR